MGAEANAALRYHADRVRRRWSGLLHGQSDQTFDLPAFQVLAQLPGPYVAWSRSSMRPSGVVWILNEIVNAHRESIVELGSGISTIYTGRLLAQRGHGHLVTVEHDPGWAAEIRRRVSEEQLSAHVTVVEAPLADGAWDTGPWYDQAVLDPALPGSGIDLLVVDGPPAYKADIQHARYPAAIHLRERLAPDCTIVLDDIWRRGEQDVVRRWEAELGRRFVRRYLDGGTAVSRA